MYRRTSEMLSIVGERDSAHAKLEARTAIRYVYTVRVHRENRPFTSLGGLATELNSHMKDRCGFLFVRL